MPLPLLSYPPTSGNHRVINYEVPGDEQPRIYSVDNLPSAVEMDSLILAAYRQIFHEQQMLASHRQRCLESQLRVGQITVKDFIRGLATSDSFRRLTYNSNNNYRFVQICIQRILGRDVESDREKFAWSIVLATKGLRGFIDDLLNSEEYLSNFGDNTVPYQRRRILPGRQTGELPFERMARYGTDYRDKLPLPKSYLPFGMFAPDEKFNYQTFVSRANWGTVSALSVSLVGLLVFFSVLIVLANSTAL